LELERDRLKDLQNGMNFIQIVKWNGFLKVMSQGRDNRPFIAYFSTS